MVRNLTLLGQGSSRRLEHSHRTPGVAPAGVRCGACRWTEITIFKDSPSTYVVVTEGKSSVPGEKTLSRSEETVAPSWVVDSLHRRGSDGERYLPKIARKALTEAAHVDDGFRAVMHLWADS